MTNSGRNGEYQRAISSDDDIDIGGLIKLLWAGKWLIGGTTFGATLVAIAVVLMLPDVYRAEALLAPNREQSAGGLSALAAQYGGLAGLAGIDFSTGASDQAELALEILQSRKFITEFIQRHDIMAPLMASNGWNSDSDQLRYDLDTFDPTTGKWAWTATSGQRTAPSLQEAYAKFRDGLFVAQSKTSNLVSVAVEHHSPNLAKQWVDWLVEDINTTIMRREVDEAEQAIVYLNEQIARTSLADLKSVFFRLIEEQTKTIVLAKVSNEYMFRTVDPAVAPELKAKPNRTAIVMLAAMFGGMISVAVVLLRNKFGVRSK